MNQKNSANDSETHINETLELTVLFPCLNEETSVGICVKEASILMEKNNINGEVLVVDNGSTDKSEVVAQNNGARVIKEEQKGYGAALLKGFENAKGRFIIMADADASYELGKIIPMVKLLRQGYEYINGSRLKGEISKGAMPTLHRRFGVPVLGFILKIFGGGSFSDSHCGMRGFSKSSINSLNLQGSGMELASEMILLAKRKKLRSTEIPIDYSPRLGSSKLRTFHDGWRHLRFLLVYSPLHVSFVPGLILTIIGFLSLFLFASGSFYLGEFFFDYHFLLFSCLICITGMQITFLGVIGKVYSSNIGISDNQGLFKFFSNLISLEKGLIIGSFCCLVGLIVLLLVVGTWIRNEYSFPSGQMIRHTILGIMFSITGLQVITNSLILSLIQNYGIKKG